MRIWILTFVAVGCGVVDKDEDGVPVDLDCDDADPARGPTIAETCNGVDDDCDGDVDEGLVVTSFPDSDGDGWGDASQGSVACEVPDGQVRQGDDCDDNAAGVHPGIREGCNGIDDDCDGTVDEDLVGTWYVDGDADGVGGTEVTGCARPSGVVELGGDCDDGNPAISPLVSETCDGVDQDCDGLVDQDVGVLQWPDVDADGYGDAVGAGALICPLTVGFTSNHADCDDTRIDIYPGASEVCDSFDQDCNGVVDEGTTVVQWPDLDGDGFGDPAGRSETCAGIAGLVGNPFDCDDTEPLAHTGATEICDAIDNDCDDRIDEGVALTWYTDADGDGAGSTATGATGCTAPLDVVFVGGDCDDGDGDIYPRAVEVCDTVDQDCDGRVDEGLTVTWYPDFDGDSYGDDAKQTVSCVAAPGSVLRGGDCDDDDATAHPLGIEVCDTVDDDCDGTVDDGVIDVFWVDDDSDGSGTVALPFTLGCTAPAGYSDAAGDCDDQDATVGGTSCPTDLPGGWSTFGGDDGRSGYIPGGVGGGDLAPLWTVSSVDLLRGPVIVDGQVLVSSDAYYYGGDDQIVALDAADGSAAWSVTLVDGTPSSPAVEGGVVYVETIDYNASKLAAVDEVTGASVWMSGVDNSYYTYEGPLVLGGSVFVAGGYDSGMFGFDVVTGVRQWRTTGIGIDQWTPVGYDGLVYSFVGVALTAQDPATGNVLSTLSLEESPPVYYSMYTVPAMAEGTALLVAGNDLVAVDVASFQVLWSLEDGFTGSPSIANGFGYAIRDGSVAQVELATGRVLRMFSGDGSLTGKPIVTDDVVIAGSLSETRVWRIWDGTQLERISVGGTVAVGEGILVINDGYALHAYAWQ